MKTVFVTIETNPVQLEDIDFELDRWDGVCLVKLTKRGYMNQIEEIVNGVVGDDYTESYPPDVRGGEEIVVDERLPAAVLAFFLRLDPSWDFRVRTWTPAMGIQDL